jgi:hypothetical protein
MRMLISIGVTVARLRLEFRVASGNKTILPQRDFTMIIDRECDTDKLIDKEKLELLAEMFLARGSPDIDWDEFLNAFSSAVAMNSVRSYIFGSLQVKM